MELITFLIEVQGLTYIAH